MAALCPPAVLTAAPEHAWAAGRVVPTPPPAFCNTAPSHPPAAGVPRLSCRPAGGPSCGGAGARAVCADGRGLGAAGARQGGPRCPAAGEGGGMCGQPAHGQPAAWQCGQRGGMHGTHATPLSPPALRCALPPRSHSARWRAPLPGPGPQFVDAYLRHFSREGLRYALEQQQQDVRRRLMDQHTERQQKQQQQQQEPRAPAAGGAPAGDRHRRRQQETDPPAARGKRPRRRA